MYVHVHVHMTSHLADMHVITVADSVTPSVDDNTHRQFPPNR